MAERPTSGVLGAAVPRREDPELLRGDAKFTADIERPGMLHVAILHSPHAHAVIRRIDTSLASKLPGVVRIFTGADLVGKMMPLPCVWKPGGIESHFPPHPYGLPGAQTALATGRVRYVGEWIAAVVAETSEQAFAALPEIQVEYELLPVVTSARAALQESAPQLHDSVPGNLCARVAYGDRSAAEQAIAEAEVVVEQRISIPRMVHHPIETRATLAEYEASTDEYTVWTNTQIPHGNRFLTANLVLGIPFNKLRVIVPNIGGGFGSKGYLYQDVPLLLFMAREVGCPVRWVDRRATLPYTTVHARNQEQHARLAGSRDGKIRALYVRNYVDIGAYPTINGPGTPSVLTGRSVTGAYVIPHAFYEVDLAFANTVMLGPARGAGRMEAMFLIERLVDLFAREIGMDPAEVRRRNLVPPDRFPFENGLGWTYDSGNYGAALERALERIGYGRVQERKSEARARGKLLGVGIACYVTISGVGPSPRMSQEGLIGSTWGVCQMRVHPTGEVTLVTGSQPHGQGHVTTLSQVAADVLGIDLERIEVLHSDTRGTPYGQGSYGSRTFAVEGAAVYRAAQSIRDRACVVAAHQLGVDPSEVVYANGRVVTRAQPERAMSLQEIGTACWYAWNLPPGMEPGLEVTVYHDPADFSFPFGTHVALVEIDEESGAVDVVRYVAVDDVGTVGNPGIVEGQMHGNIAFGLGPALLESVEYDDGGQLVRGDFREHGMLRASQMPVFETERTVTPTPLHPIGAKGAGDVSQPAVAPAVVNAICDALSGKGIRHLDLPVTPEKIWRALQARES
jgi:aerobic carbon-monoxide dehydrogenase large subunit